MRRRLAAGAALVVCVSALAGAVGATWAQARTLSSSSSSSSSSSARALLIARSDLGSGWTVEAPAPPTVPALACARLHLRLRGGEARPLQAASPTFAAASDGPFVGQTAYRYPDVADERQVWRGVARPALLTCLAESFVQGGGHGVRFRVVSQRERSAPRLAVTAASYALKATATRGTQSTDVYLDVLLLGGGTGVTELSFSSVPGPPPPPLELRLARIVAARLAGHPGAGTVTRLAGHRGAGTVTQAGRPPGRRDRRRLTGAPRHPDR
jgi:hypothetical protein